MKFFTRLMAIASSFCFDEDGHIATWWFAVTFLLPGTLLLAMAFSGQADGVWRWVCSVFGLGAVATFGWKLAAKDARRAAERRELFKRIRSREQTYNEVEWALRNLPAQDWSIPYGLGCSECNNLQFFKVSHIPNYPAQIIEAGIARNLGALGTIRAMQEHCGWKALESGWLCPHCTGVGHHAQVQATFMKMPEEE